jgi:hypothetical protein
MPILGERTGYFAGSSTANSRASKTPHERGFSESG